MQPGRDPCHTSKSTAVRAVTSELKDNARSARLGVSSSSAKVPRRPGVGLTSGLNRRELSASPTKNSVTGSDGTRPYQSSK